MNPTEKSKLNPIESYAQKRKLARLEGDVIKTQNLLFLMKQKLPLPLPAWIDYVEQGLETVTDKAKTDNDLAWRIYKSYRRMLIQGMDINVCLAEALYLINISTRLDDVSKKNINDLFPPAYLTYSLAQLQTNVEAATEIKDNYYDSEYNKLYMSQLNIRYVLTWFLIAVGVFTILYSVSVNFNLTSCFLGSPKYILTLEIFGFFGAVFSIVTKLTTSNPDEVTTSLQDDSYPLMRSFIGPGAALIMYLFVQSGIINPQFFYLTSANLSTPNATLKKDSVIVKTSIIPKKDTLNKVVSTKIDTSAESKNNGIPKTGSSIIASKSNIVTKGDSITTNVTTTVIKGDDCGCGGVPPSYLMYILAFLAGFSEKLVVQILDKIANKVK